jgi:hypothetical protein
LALKCAGLSVRSQKLSIRGRTQPDSVTKLFLLKDTKVQVQFGPS